MSETKGITGPKFNCPACGKEYKLKPELAGKKGKCKCGSVMMVPAKAPKTKAAPAPRMEEDLYDMAGGPSAQEDAMSAPPPYVPAAAPHRRMSRPPQEPRSQRRRRPLADAS
jgi:hypothetical protein